MIRVTDALARRRACAADHTPPSACLDCQARGLAVCGALDDGELARLAASLETVTFAPGETLAREGEPARSVFSITSGSVRLYKLLADGRRQITGFLAPGDLFGLSAAERYGVTAEAIDHVEACRFRRPDYERASGEMPALQAALLQRAGEDLRAAQEHVVLLGRKTAPERLASFLLSQSAAARRAGRDAERLSLPMTRGEIADHLGLTTETVSRLFTRFKDERLIRLEGLHGVVLLRPDDLAELAAGA